MAVLHRVCPDPQLCTSEIVRVVISKHARAPNPPVSPESDRTVTDLLNQYIDLADEAVDKFSLDPAVISRTFAEYLPSRSLAAIVKSMFDLPAQEFTLPDLWGSKALAAFIGSSPTAFSALWETWQNTPQLLDLLSHLANISSETFAPGNLPNIRRVLSMDDVASAQQSIRGLAHSIQGSFWNCADLTRTLVKLSESEDCASKVADIFDRGMKTNPELVLLGLVTIDKPWNGLHNRIVTDLISSFLSGQPSHQLVFYRLWQIDHNLVLASFRESYLDNELNIGRIVDVAQDLLILQEVLELRPFQLALDAAALASRREFLELTRWLQNCIQRFGAQFVKETLAFVGNKVKVELKRNEMDPPPEASTMPLIAGAVAIFMRALRMKCVSPISNLDNN